MSGAVSRAWSVAALAVALLAGCADTDPYLKQGQWQPRGANMLNLAAMLANPADLQRGHGDRGATGYEAAMPVTRLSMGRPAALPAGASNRAPSGEANAAPSAVPN